MLVNGQTNKYNILSFSIKCLILNCIYSKNSHFAFLMISFIISFSSVHKPPAVLSFTVDLNYYYFFFLDVLMRKQDKNTNLRMISNNAKRQYAS